MTNREGAPSALSYFNKGVSGANSRSVILSGGGELQPENGKYNLHVLNTRTKENKALQLWQKRPLLPYLALQALQRASKSHVRACLLESIVCGRRFKRFKTLQNSEQALQRFTPL